MSESQKQKTIVTLLLDRSASMMQIRDTTIAGVNAWIEELRKTKDDMLFSLIQEFQLMITFLIQKKIII